VDLCGSQRGKSHRPEELDRGSFWRGTALDIDTKLRVARAIEKNEEVVAAAMMLQIKDRYSPVEPPAIASDGNDSYPEAMLETWGRLPNYSGRGRPPTKKQLQKNWKCIQVTKHRSGGRLIGITHRVVYGNPKDVCDLMGLNTAYVERTNLTSRQMNGRMVRKTLSFSKKYKMLKASCAWEDAVYNLTRSVKTLRLEINEGLKRWKYRSAAMAAGLTNHIWTIKELMMTVVVPDANNTI
jgi:hypothetical protein